MQLADIFETLNRAEHALEEELDYLHHNPKAEEDQVVAAEAALAAIPELRKRIASTFQEIAVGVFQRISHEATTKGFSRKEQQRARQAAIAQLGIVH